MASESRTGAAKARCVHALVPELPWHRGEIELAGRACRFEVRATFGGVSHVVFAAIDEIGAPDAGSPTAAELDPDAVVGWLARAGSPVLAEREGGYRATRASRADRALWYAAPDAVPSLWPEPFRADATSRKPKDGRLGISGATARALRSGHPWVLADAETGPVEGFAPGAVVRLEGPKGRTHGLARIDDEQPVVARIWALEAEHPRQAPSIEARIAKALSRRQREIARLGSFGALRLVHGEADALPGFHADWLGGCLRVLLSARCALPIRERAVSALVSRLTPANVIEVIHLKHAPPGRLECVRRVPGGYAEGPPDAAPQVEESGLRFRIDLGLSEPTRARPGVGFFLDQRLARKEVRRRARSGGRYLNLFAHTGAFSAVLLAAGAAQVTSVDLSAPYLGWLEENLALSDLLDSRHQTVQRDVRRFLEEAGDARYDGIVLDPPTAAAAGRRFLATRRELAELLASTLRLLAPGGWLYVSRNDRRGRGRLKQLIEEAAGMAGVAGYELTKGRVPNDFPELAGFPEGTPFEACWLTKQR